jgi:phytoene/squalene synthetase
MKKLYDSISFRTSRLITKSYSTSFSSAVSFLNSDIQNAIYSIYGFVRLADEIVDTFHEYDKKALLDKFERDFNEAVNYGISLNPALNSFQQTVKKYNIDDALIRAFLKSMRTDLYKSDHISRDETDEYIYGSAEVVGLMCLKVFVDGDEALYNELKDPARRLGAAFQKVNFLRDIRNDTQDLNRKYFHNTVGSEFDEKVKTEIINDIKNDFDSSLKGLKNLPESSRLGVLVAYYYYRNLLKKISRTPAGELMEKRIRVSDRVKLIILGKAIVVSKFNLL